MERERKYSNAVSIGSSKRHHAVKTTAHSTLTFLGFFCASKSPESQKGPLPPKPAGRKKKLNHQTQKRKAEKAKWFLTLPLPHLKPRSVYNYSMHKHPPLAAYSISLFMRKEGRGDPRSGKPVFVLWASLTAAAVTHTI